MWKKEILVHSWWECKLVQPLQKTAWTFLKRLKMEIPYDPAVPLLGIYPKDKGTNLERYMQPNFCNHTVYNSQDMEATQVSVNRSLNSLSRNKRTKIISTYQNLKITNYNIFNRFFKCMNLYTSRSFTGILKQFQLLYTQTK